MASQGVKIAVVALAGWVAYQYYLQTTADPISDGETDPSNDAINSGLGPLQTLYENLMTTVNPNAWMTQNEGPTYLPYFNSVESQYGIPANLLARVGYQESRFRADIISGKVTSTAGAVGIMQLLPQYFPNAGSNPDADIETAGEYLAKLYGQFGDWQLAVAAYNDGPGNVSGFLSGTHTLPAETQNYVAAVFADVPVNGSLIQVA